MYNSFQLSMEVWQTSWMNGRRCMEQILFNKTVICKIKQPLHWRFYTHPLFLCSIP